MRLEFLHSCHYSQNDVCFGLSLLQCSPKTAGGTGRGYCQLIVPTTNPSLSKMRRPTTRPPGGTRTGGRVGGVGVGVGGVGSLTTVTGGIF